MLQPHKGSQETYEFIADWIDPRFFFSRNDVWHRMGIIGVFGDYVLSTIAQGHIAEIGVGESSIYLTALAKKYHRKIYHCDIAPDKILNPLTVPGYLTEPNTYLTPDSTHILYERCVLFAGPSDDFFRDVKMGPLALSFIDGDHNYAQAKKDFQNLLARTVNGGFILLHDTHPPDESYLPDYRCGDVYKLRQEIEKDPNLDSITLTQGTAMGVGITIVRKKGQDLPEYQQ